MTVLHTILFNLILCFHYRSSDIFLKDEDRQIATLDQEKIKEDTIALLKTICQSDVGTNYKLGKAIFNMNILAFNKLPLEQYLCYEQHLSKQKKPTNNSCSPKRGVPNRPQR